MSNANAKAESAREHWQVQMLFEHCVSPFVSLLIIPPLLCYVLSAVVPSSVIWPWLAVMCVVTFVRIVHALRYFQLARRRALQNPRRWKLEYCAGVLCSGLLWAAGVWLLFPSESVMHQAFVCFVVAGMVAGAVSSYSPSLVAVTCFLVSFLVPFSLRLVLEGTQIHSITAMMTLVFLALCLNTARRLNYYLREHYRLLGDQTFLLQRLQTTNEELQASLASLSQSQVETLHASRLAAVGEMSAGIAHEINNPLAIIEGTAQRIVELSERDLLTKENLLQGLDRVRQTVQRISTVIRGLLAFSRSSHGGASPTSVDKILTQTLDLCRQRFLMNGISLQVAPTPCDLIVHCRSVPISQVLLNLLNNAYDAAASSKERRWVKLEVFDRGDAVEFSVTDSGKVKPGTQPEEWFHPFYTTKEVGKGTGLGLSVSKGIVEVHGGRIWVELKPDHTRVAFSLPKQTAMRAAA